MAVAEILEFESFINKEVNKESILAINLIINSFLNKQKNFKSDIIKNIKLISGIDLELL
jgi:hypothetical protein